MIGSTISHYKIIEKLGEGGMGIVYKAHDTTLDRFVALKFLPNYLTSDANEKERFYHEARAASALNHPNITTIHEIQEFEGRIYLAMEYVEGMTLKRLIEDDAPKVKKVLDMAIQACDGLAAAHEKGIVHRDVKSDNIMITLKGQIKITDFGLAKVKGATKLTKAGSTIGTAAYMSPEQAQGEEVDMRSDIFSFGVVLYELLTTRLPFRGEHQAAMMYSLMNEDPAPIARFNEQVTPELERVVMKSLAKDKEDRYQHVDEMLADLRRERKQIEYARAGYTTMSTSTRAIPAAAAPLKKRTPFYYLVPAGMFVAAVLVLAIFNPFNFQLTTQKSNAAEKNSVAVMYFENISDPQDQDRVAKMMTSLLITNLSESKSLKVMSTQRLYDLLKQLGKEDLKVIDKGVASEIAKKSGVSLVLTGEILQVKPTIVATAEISESDGGKILVAEKVAGLPGEDVFSVVDKLSANIRKSLFPEQQAAQEQGKRVADITTHSPEAYRYYTEGIELSDKLYAREAIPVFLKAIAIDSTFAMAYYELALCGATIGEGGSSGLSYIKKASRYSDRVTQKERDFILASEAEFSGNIRASMALFENYVATYPDDKRGFFALAIAYRTGGYTKMEVNALLKVVELDPFNKNGYNALAYAYDDAGEFEKSIEAINKYISLAPDEPNPYDSRGDIYATHGKVSEALESYTMALGRKHDFYESLQKVGFMHIYRKEFESADSCSKILLATQEPSVRQLGNLLAVYSVMYQGKFTSALAETERWIAGAATPLESRREDEISFHSLRARICSLQHNFSAAVQEYEKIVKILTENHVNGPAFGRPLLVMMYAKNSELRNAEVLAAKLKEDIVREDTSSMPSYWFAMGWIERSKGNTEAAIAAFEKAVAGNQFYLRHLALGCAYLDVNRLGEAVTEFEKLQINYFDVNRLDVWGIQVNYYLGIAYEKSGWTQKAIAQYQEFLDVLKNADKGIPEVDDARVRLAKLMKKA